MRGHLSLSQRLPLRKTSSLGSYEFIQAIPQVYGRARITPFRYDKAGVLWGMSGHAINGVDEVTRDNLATIAFDWRNTTDRTGHSMALLELHAPLQTGEALAVKVRGKPHPATGQLMTNPALITWDILANVCGQSITLDDVQAFRDECAAAEIEAQLVLNDDTLTIRGALSVLMDGIGARWSPAAHGFARLWPS